MIQCCFVNTDQFPVKTEHVCYFTNSDGENISLLEVVREYYPHPEAPENARVSVVTTKHVKTYFRTSVRGANVILLEAAQNACKNEKENR